MDFWKRLPSLAITVLLCLAAPWAPVDSPAAPADRIANSDRRETLRIGVLGLFHTDEFEIRALAGQALLLEAGSEAVPIESSSGIGSVVLSRSGSGVRVTAGARKFEAASVMLRGQDGRSADFVLSIPGKISRRYRGVVEISSSGGNLVAILGINCETAVASIVAAETEPDTPIEGLKAQAIAARSYLVAGRARHREFDFCDTTHCQFLREPPPEDSNVARAVAATRALVLAYNSRPFPAMYSRSCSGRTHTPAQVGLPAAGYPYYSVDCAYCRAHPQRWTRTVPMSEASSLHSSDEPSRLEIDGRLGWSTVPGNDFVARREGGTLVLSGAGNGHGIGLCQSGAKAMAESGASFRDILRHYYPNTSLVNFAAQ